MLESDSPDNINKLTSFTTPSHFKRQKTSNETFSIIKNGGHQSDDSENEDDELVDLSASPDDINSNVCRKKRGLKILSVKV